MHFIHDVQEYYFKHLLDLDDAKQFHFASRLAAWTGDQRYLDVLDGLEAFILPKTSSSDFGLGRLLTKPIGPSRIAAELRAPYFERFPNLYGLELALFRLRHAQYVYATDISNSLFAYETPQDIKNLQEQLLASDEAIKYLSTYAINFCYLADILVNRKEPEIDLDRIIKIGATYDLHDPVHIQLFLYLYTHCIIAETNFYIRPIRPALIQTFQKMLRTAEGVIDQNFTDISLDNKLEFLVCTRICNYTSRIESRVYKECSESLSDEGVFIVDKHNSAIRASRQSFSASEHRNALLILSATPYRPHSTLVR